MSTNVGDQPHRNGAAPALGVAAGLLLGGIAPAIVIGGTPDHVYPGWLGATAIAIVSGARFGWIVGSAKRRLFEMTTWLFVYVFLGLAPMVQLRLGVDPSTTPAIFHELDFVTAAIVLVGCGGIMLGSHIGKSAAGKHPPAQSGKRYSNPALTRWRVNVLAATALLSALFYISQVGIFALFTPRDSLSAIRGATLAGLGTTIPVATVVSGTLLVSMLAQLQRRRELALNEARPVALLGLTFLSLVVCVNPVSSSRYAFGTMALALLGGVGVYGTLRRFRIVAAMSVVGILFLFPLLDAFRRTLDPTIALQSPFQSLVEGDFDSFAQVNNSVLYVNESGPTWGRQALAVPLFWVPRSLWTTKPVDTGTLLAQFRGYEYQNLSAPLWSELFINGGWTLLVAGTLLFGYCLRRADEYTEQILRGGSVPPLLACIIPFYLLLILRGSLLQSMASLSILLLSWWFVTAGSGVRPWKSEIAEAKRGAAQT